jgi:acyl carrier protein
VSVNELVSLEDAVVRRICTQLAYEPGPDANIDHKTSFFSVDGFRIGEYELNSMDLVELILTLEEEFEVSILEGNDISEIDTIEKLSTYIASNADEGRIEEFIKTWS